jgi:hypothetical protein
VRACPSFETASGAVRNSLRCRPKQPPVASETTSGGVRNNLRWRPKQPPVASRAPAMCSEATSGGVRSGLRRLPGACQLLRNGRDGITDGCFRFPDHPIIPPGGFRDFIHPMPVPGHGCRSLDRLSPHVEALYAAATATSHHILESRRRSSEEEELRSDGPPGERSRTPAVQWRVSGEKR